MASSSSSVTRVCRVAIRTAPGARLPPRLRLTWHSAEHYARRFHVRNDTSWMRSGMRRISARDTGRCSTSCKWKSSEVEKWKSKWKSGLAAAFLLLLVGGQAGAQDTLPKVTLEDDKGVDVLGAF